MNIENTSNKTPESIVTDKRQSGDTQENRLGNISNTVSNTNTKKIKIIQGLEPKSSNPSW